MLRVITSSLIIILFTISTSYTASSKPAYTEVKSWYYQQLNALIQKMEKFHHQTEFIGSKKCNENKLKESFLQARYQYKKVEFLLTYFQPGLEGYFNAPNLPRIDDSDFSFGANKPEGFQVYEETVFDGPICKAPEKAKQLSKNLVFYAKKAKKLLGKKRFFDRVVLESVREQVIRTTSMGITGFDSPVLAASVTESRYAMEGIAVALEHYLSQIEDNGFRKEVRKTLKNGIKYLKKNPDFDTFNRFVFIRDYMEPLYGYILDIHHKLNIETHELAQVPPRPVNYQSRRIFSQDFVNPEYFVEVPYDKQDSRKIELGKILFFDPILSDNNKRSCASCHRPELGFTDGMEKSMAFDRKGTVDRNSPTLLNAALQSPLFWDMREEFLEDQIDHVVFDHREFKTGLTPILNKLQGIEEYQQLFHQAFPGFDSVGTAINAGTLKKALAQYVRSLISLDAPFDKMIQGKQEPDPQVVEGFNLFMGKAACATCHFPPAFNGMVPPHYSEAESEILGTPDRNDSNQTLSPDIGRGKFDFNDFFKHAFKTPTVRNAEITGPYMHNGVFPDLESLMDFYNQGGGEGIGYDVPNQTLPPDSLHLTEKEIASVITFMEALTDTTGLLDKPKVLPGQEKSRLVGGEY